MSSEKLSIKLPEFIEGSPVTWWYTCMSVFEAKKVTKEIDRYHHLIAALPSSVTVKLLDVLSYEGEKDKEGERLQFLKTRLMELYAPSEYDCYQKMMQLAVLRPGQKPSDLYANLRSLLPHDASQDIDDSFLFRMMFLSKLPTSIQSLVQAQGRRPVSQMAAFADTVALAHSKPSLPVQTASLSWVEEMEAAEREAEAAQAVQAVRVNKRVNKKKSAENNAGLCFYHNKFGPKAEKCEGQGCKLAPPTTVWDRLGPSPSTSKKSGN